MVKKKILSIALSLVLGLGSTAFVSPAVFAAEETEIVYLPETGTSTELQNEEAFHMTLPEAVEEPASLETALELQDSGADDSAGEALPDAAVTDEAKETAPGGSDTAETEAETEAQDEAGTETPAESEGPDETEVTAETESVQEPKALEETGADSDEEEPGNTGEEDNPSRCAVMGVPFHFRGLSTLKITLPGTPRGRTTTISSGTGTPCRDGNGPMKGGIMFSPPKMKRPPTISQILCRFRKAGRILSRFAGSMRTMTPPVKTGGG